jgi:hypothetical protein
MDARILSDPYYQIVVAMAETLVPDVCALIMAELELIHIEKGRQEWKKKISVVNAEYLKEMIETYSNYYAKSNKVRMGFFGFNYRTLEYAEYTHLIWNYNVGCHKPVAQLPTNY